MKMQGHLNKFSQLFDQSTPKTNQNTSKRLCNRGNIEKKNYSHQSKAY